MVDLYSIFQGDVIKNVVFRFFCGRNDDVFNAADFFCAINDMFDNWPAAYFQKSFFGQTPRIETNGNIAGKNRFFSFCSQ